MDQVQLDSIQDDLIIPFKLEKSSLRGRIVRCGTTLNDILQAHKYPKPVSHIVAEAATLSLCLSSMLKYKGIFTLQAQGDGPIGMVVSDVASPASVRGCASFDNERVDHARQQLAAMAVPETSQNHLAQYLGKGYIAFTVDQGEHTERYQGIVELDGASLVDCVQHYFRQSEQIDTGIRMAVGQREDEWRSAAIMLQYLPDEGGLERGELPAQSNLDEDAWRRSMILMQSATDDELLSTEVNATDLLLRLFHEEGVRVFDPIRVEKGCRCTSERLETVVKMLPDEDKEYMIKDGRIEMLCEFCSTAFYLDPKKLKVVETVKGQDRA